MCENAAMRGISTLTTLAAIAGIYNPVERGVNGWTEVVLSFTSLCVLLIGARMRHERAVMMDGRERD